MFVFIFYVEYDLSNFVFALGIKNVGAKTAKDLVKNFKTFENIKNARLDQLLEIRDIGEIVAKSVYDYFNNEKNIKEIENLFEKGITLLTEEIEESELLNKKVVLTGTLTSMSRLEAPKFLEKKGAVVQSAVSKLTDLVIAGENAGSKLEKAKKLGVEVISEEEFLEFLKK